MRVSREELLNCLNRVVAGLSNRNFIEQSGCFIFRAGWVCTFNDEVCVRTKTPFTPEAPEVLGAVRAKPLIGVLSAMSDDEIDVTTTDKEFRVSKGRKRTWVRLEEKIRLPVDQVEPPPREAWKELPEDFTRGVEQVSQVCARDEEEFLTVVVHLTPQWVEASDRAQICRFKMPIPISHSFLVRAKYLKPIVGLDLVRVAENGDWLHLRNKTLIYSCRRHLEAYPDLTGPLEFKGEPAMLPQGAVEAARLGSVFSSDDKDNDKVHVTLNDGNMNVEGTGTHGGASVNLECSYRGKDVSFYVGPKMLEKLIENFSDCEISPDRLSVHGENWDYVVGLSQEKERKVDKPNKKQEKEKPQTDEEYEESDFEGADTDTEESGGDDLPY